MPAGTFDRVRSNLASTTVRDELARALFVWADSVFPGEEVPKEPWRTIEERTDDAGAVVAPVDQTSAGLARLRREVNSECLHATPSCQCASRPVSCHSSRSASRASEASRRRSSSG